MTQARLRIVGPSNIEIKNYYFSLEEAAEYLGVPEKWVRMNMDQLDEPIQRWGTWYFSPNDYHKLRDLRDET